MSGESTPTFGPLPDDVTKEIADHMRELLLPLTDDQRLEVLRAIGFCKECGCNDPGHACQCWNDE